MPTLLRDEQLPGGKRQTIWGLCEWRADATPDVLAFVDEDRRASPLASTAISR